jgi:hypothetical protein
LLWATICTCANLFWEYLHTVNLLVND